jgi:hypothetical protein
MSVPGSLDVRIPIGGLFTVVGVLLAGYGARTAGDATLYARSLSINVNLWWGGAMLVFGLVLLGLAWKRGRDDRNATDR